MQPEEVGHGPQRFLGVALNQSQDALVDTKEEFRSKRGDRGGKQANFSVF